MDESQKFIKLEALSAKLLFCATVLALCISNSSLGNDYNSFFHTYIYSQIGALNFKSNLLFWINEGLMTIFFLVVGLEIKYEILQGTLNTVRKAALPGIGAIGGMLVPAVIYMLLNHGDATMLRGWAVPTATDIAFSLAILSLVKPRVHASLKVFLTTLAIFDDLAAILIIALFYTEQLSIVYLGMSAVCVFILLLLNKRGVTQLSAYLLIGSVLWACLVKSGIHATFAGVILALMIPLRNMKKPNHSPLRQLQHAIHPCVALIILPLFAFANAGVSFLTLPTENLHFTIILGVIFGLFFGKQLGIFCFTWLAVKLRIAILPDHMRWCELYAISIICGIGFTISLFIGSLAFNNHSSYLHSIKIGVLSGSLLSGVAGYVLLQLIQHCHYKKSNKN